LAIANLKTGKVGLRVIERSDFQALLPIALDAETWQYTTTAILNPPALVAYIDKALADFSGNSRIPFVILDLKTNELIGSSSLGNISEHDQRIEIGWTWLATNYRGKGHNLHVKYLLLKFCFEILGYKRVEFKTDLLNMRSRRALTKIGASEEGVLKSHMLMHDGRRRDTVYYSILSPDWPAIRASLQKDGRIAEDK